MKNLRLTLGIAAIAIGSFAAFSFAPTSNETDPEPTQFYVNPDGSRADIVNGSNRCKPTTPALCSQEYQYNSSTDLWEPTNDSSKMHYGVKQ